MQGHVRHHACAGQQHGDRRFQGFRAQADLVGVGYRAQAQGDKLNLSLGFRTRLSPDACRHQGRDSDSDRNRDQGCRQAGVGKVAAEVRAYRAPEPYKGKGVRYSDEVVTLKETKKK
jgi:large subunit ribosomal protein L6